MAAILITHLFSFALTMDNFTWAGLLVQYGQLRLLYESGEQALEFVREHVFVKP